MSVKTEYVCDRCGNSQPTHEQFWVVGVVAHTYDRQPSACDFGNRRMQVCRPCLEVLGVHRRKPEQEAAPIPPPLTVEELIREIVQQEIGEALR